MKYITVKYITALALVASLSIAGHPVKNTASLSAPDKPDVSAPVSFADVNTPQFRYVVVLNDFGIIDYVQAFCPAVLDTRQRVPQITASYLNIQPSFGRIRQTKGVASSLARTVAVARSTI